MSPQRRTTSTPPEVVRRTRSEPNILLNVKDKTQDIPEKKPESEACDVINISSNPSETSLDSLPGLLYGHQGEFATHAPREQLCMCQLAGAGQRNFPCQCLDPHLLLDLRLQVVQQMFKSSINDLSCIMDKTFSLDNDVEQALALLPMASRLGMPALVRRCDAILIKELNVTTCIKTFRLAQQLDGHDQLLGKSRKFILNNFHEVWKKSADLTELTFDELKFLLTSDLLVIDKEENVFWVICRWIDADPAKRKTYYPCLIKALRLPCCEKEFLQELLSHPLTRDCPSTVKSINEVLSVLEDCPEQVDKLDSSLHRRKPKDKKVLTIYALGGRTSRDMDEVSFETLDPITRQWTYRKDIQDQPFGDTHVIAMKKEIFVLELDSERVRSFDPVTKKWHKRASLPFKVRGISVAAIGDCIYIMGGYFSKGTATNRCLMYNLESCHWWEVLPSMSISRARGSATTFKGKIYCSGGRNCYYKTMNTMESFDLVEKKWADETAMLKCRWGHSLVSCSSYIWAFGGCRTTMTLNEVEQYNPLTGVWTMMAPMLTRRRSLAVTMYEGLFYAVGGIDGDVAIRTTEVYDPEIGLWQKSSDLCRARGACGACVFKYGGAT